jgi:hypothetical protein
MQVFTNTVQKIFQNNLILESYFLFFVGTEHNFQKFGWRVMQSLGVTYDTGEDINLLLCLILNTNVE